MLYSIDEICLIPAAVSPIKHRGDVIIYNNHDMLPIFSAPMGCVIDERNYSAFEDVGINTIIPRTVHWDDRYELIEEGKWVAVGYKEAKWLYDLWKEDVEVGGLQENKIHLCIDQADGHLEDLITLCFELKELLGNHIKIMTGNVANPFVYKEYARAGIDYVRVGIGGGSACFVTGTKITTNNGYKNIEDIKPGDIVMTTAGEKTVKTTFNKVTDTLITINNDITCTPNHKFLVINKADKDLVTDQNLSEYSFYIEADKLTDNYLLVKA